MSIMLKKMSDKSVLNDLMMQMGDEKESQGSQMRIVSPMTEKEVANILGMSVHWLRRKRWEGGGPKYVKMGSGNRSAVRYLAEDLNEYINKHRRSSTSA